MESRATLALLAVVVLSAGLAGCLSGEDEQRTRADELAAGAVEAMGEVDSYTASMTVDVTAESEGQSVSGSLDMDMRVDQADRRMELEQSIDLAGIQQTATGYADDEALYLGVAGTWQERELPENAWAGPGTAQDGQLSLLEEADFTHVRNETIDGVETAVLRIDMGPDEYQDFLAEQAENSDVGGTAQLGQAFEFESIDVRQYVAREAPHHVHRVELDLQISQERQGQTIEGDISGVVEYDDFEEEITVEPPEGLVDSEIYDG